MPSIRLHLRAKRPDKNGLCEIDLIYQHEGVETYFPTGRKILPRYWDQKSVASWVKPDYGDSCVTFNLILKKMKNDAEEKMNKFFLNEGRYPNREEMKVLMNSKTVVKSFFHLFKLFISDRTASITTGTYNNYNKVYRRFEEYQKHTGIPFGFHSINHGFHTAFTNYLEKEFELKSNSIGAYFRVLKTFLHWASLHHNVEIDKVVMANMHVVNEENFYVWLSKVEIDKLAALDLVGEDNILIRSRDAFVLQCCFGCRYGDLEKTMKENIVLENGNYMFRIKTRKNQKLVQVPLSRRAIAILNKYQGVAASDWVPPISYCNLHIKTICKLAEFYETVQMVRGTGNNRKQERFQKWQLISTHTARRSFINTMLADGVNEHVVAAMTGQHIQTIQRYKHADTRDILNAITIWDKPAPESKESGAPRQPE